jgi:glycine/D-amino acid oxidase-like deaminating enzyme
MVDKTETRVQRGRSTGVKHEIYWRSTEPVEYGPPLRGNVTCDVAMVGGGYTSMWTAYFLKQADPSLSIHIVEADYAGAGGSGHNDGFVTPTIGHSLHGVVKQYGHDRAKLAYSVVGRSILELNRFCRKHGVDAEFEPNGYYMVAANAAQIRRLEHDLGLIAEITGGSGQPLLTGTEARQRIGSPGIEAAFKVGGALINPHKLARGLARVVRDLGVVIHERTPATNVTRSAAGHVVTTPGGTVTADQLVLATNAYQHQFRPFRASLRPVWSYAAVTEPLTDEQLAQVHWPDREGFVEARNFIMFCRLTAGNRLLVGGGPAPYHYGRDMDESKHMANAKATTVLREILARYFPAWRNLPFSHAYGGCISMTRNLIPHVGTLESGAHYAYGYCGNGISMTHTSGKVLRDLVLGKDSAFTNLLFVGGREPKMPVEPLAFLGARALSATLAVQDRFPGLLRKPLV